MLNLWLECAVPQEWLESDTSLIPRKAALLTRDGMMHVISCPHGTFYLYRESGGLFRLTTQKGPPQLPSRQGDMEKDGPRLWKMMHRGMLTLETPEERERLVDRTQGLLPCGSCKRDFAELRKTMPADYSTADTAFASSWRWHAAVSARLGKIEMGMDEARGLYLGAAPTHPENAVEDVGAIAVAPRANS